MRRARRRSASWCAAWAARTVACSPLPPRLSERSPLIDVALARRRFSRAAAGYAGAARLEGEVAARMLERLALVKLAPKRVLDAGAGDGGAAPALKKKYPAAEIVALDYSLGMLRASKRGWFRAKPLRVCADLARL